LQPLHPIPRHDGVTSTPASTPLSTTPSPHFPQQFFVQAHLVCIIRLGDILKTYTVYLFDKKHIHTIAAQPRWTR